jgi:acetyl esterase
MPLDPQAARALQILAMMPPIEYSSDGTYARSVLAELPPAPSPFAEGDQVAAIEDRTIEGPGGPLNLRLYYPLPDAASLPLTLYFHGGGFVFGSPALHDNVCRCLAKRATSLVVSVDYRLAPEFKFPAPIEDGWATLNWLRGNGTGLRGDPNRVAVAGDSAGGNIAAVIAQKARDHGVELKHQVLLYPVTDCSLDTPSYTEMGNDYYLTREMMEWFWNQYLPDNNARQHPLASPYKQKALERVAPATILTAEFDPLRDEGEAYGLTLMKAGVPVHMRRWPGQIHGFASMLGVLDAADEALSWAARSLRSSFEPADIHS